MAGHRSGSAVGEPAQEVIQYSTGYGAHGCALTANVITYRGRSAVRDIGKGAGIRPDILDKLSAQLSRYESRTAMTKQRCRSRSASGSGGGR